MLKHRVSSDFLASLRVISRGQVDPHEI